MTSAYATFPIQGGHDGRSSGDRPRAVQWGCELTRAWRPPPGLAAARACAWCGYHHTDLRVLNLRSGRGARLSNALAHGSQAMDVGFCEIAAARLDGRLSIRPLEPPALDVAATFAALAAAEVLDGPQYRPRKRLVELRHVDVLRTDSGPRTDIARCFEEASNLQASDMTLVRRHLIDGRRPASLRRAQAVDGPLTQAAGPLSARDRHGAGAVAVPAAVRSVVGVGDHSRRPVVPECERTPDHR